MELENDMISRFLSRFVGAARTRNPAPLRGRCTGTAAIAALALVTAGHAQPACADRTSPARSAIIHLGSTLFAQTEKTTPTTTSPQSPGKNRTVTLSRRPRTDPAIGPLYIPDPSTKGMQSLVREAIDKARNVVSEKPNSTSAWTRLGATCDAHAMFDCAEYAYARAFELDPADYRNPYLQAVVMEVAGRKPAKVINLYQQAHALEPTYAPILWRLARALEQLGRRGEALEFYLRSTELGEPLAIGHRSAGQLLIASGKHTEAEKHLQRAAALTPGDGAVHAALAQLYRRLDQPKRAEQHADKAREFEPVFDVPDQLRDKMRSLAVDSLTLMFRAKNAIRGGDYATATPLFALCERALPNDASLQVYLATCYRATDRPDLALKHAKRALSLNPDSLSAILELGAAHVIKGDLDKALKYYERAQELNPDNPRVDTWMADVFIKASYNNFGIIAMERAQEKGTVKAHPHWMWGVALTENGDTYEAMEHFRKAIKLNSKFVNAYYSLGLALESLDRLDDAIEQYKKGATLDRNHLAAQRLGMLGIEIP